MVSGWAGRIAIGLVAAAFACGLTAISADGIKLSGAFAQEPVKADFPVTTNHPVGHAFLMDFTAGPDPSTQYISDFDVDADWILMAFRRENVVFDGQGLSLLARRNRDGAMRYTMAELQRQGFYGYGRYEVIMRSSNAPGVVSSFFTHTGEYFGDPHTEIDFEFVGRSPRNVHLNYFTKGHDDPNVMDLWFDASKGYHLYAFEWLPDSIVWYIDGVKVRTVTQATSPIGIPAVSSRVIANIWTANRQAEEWAGLADFKETKAIYRCVSHVPAGKAARQCSDTFTPPKRP